MEMDYVLLLVQKLNISKVSLAAYLGVSRQMVYNYLSKNSIDQWPLDKQIKLLELFEVKNIYELENIDINSEQLSRIRMKLEHSKSESISEIFDKLDSKTQLIVTDIINLCEDESTIDDINTLLTLIEHSMITTEYKYLIMYLAKVFGKIKSDQFLDDINNQKAFEGILFSAFSLFNSNKYSKEKIEKAHLEFIKSLQIKSEVDHQATNVINVTKIIAKRELGIDTIDDSNIDLVLEKMVEIQKRKL